MRVVEPGGVGGHHDETVVRLAVVQVPAARPHARLELVPRKIHPRVRATPRIQLGMGNHVAQLRIRRPAVAHDFGRDGNLPVGEPVGGDLGVDHLDPQRPVVDAGLAAVHVRMAGRVANVPGGARLGHRRPDEVTVLGFVLGGHEPVEARTVVRPGDHGYGARGGRAGGGVDDDRTSSTGWSGRGLETWPKARMPGYQRSRRANGAGRSCGVSLNW